MATSPVRTHAIYSLRTQLVVGTMLLLGLTVAAISYALLQQDKSMLEEEMEKTIVLQGRNTALGAERALLRPDPEFELFPLVKRILSDNANITSVVITDRNGMIQGDRELRNLAKEFDWDVSGHESRTRDFILSSEQLYLSRDDYRFRTPVKSRDQTIGHVYVEYSRQEFHEAVAHSMSITLIIGSGAFALAILLSLLLFQRISRPMGVLMHGVEQLGNGDMTTRIAVSVRNEFSVLAQSFNDMASRISRAQDELVVKERMERELEIAREIQETLIPAESFEAEGIEIGTFYEAAEQVGGDYLDIIPMDDRNVAFVMADVSGKGVPGLVVMAMLKIMVRSLVAKGVSPREVIRRLNVSVAEHVQEKMFVTFFIAYVNLDTAVVTYSNAGHNPIVFYRRAGGHCEMQKMKGPLLGVFKDEIYSPQLEQYETTLEPGDLMMQYTDGLNESTNRSGDMFTFDRVIEVSEKAGSQGAKSLVRAMRKAERQFRGTAPQADDITMLAVSMKSRERVAQESTGD